MAFNAITIELCTEDRARLDALRQVLDKLAPTTVTVGMDTLRALAQPEPAPVPETAPAEPEKPAQPAEPPQATVSAEQLQSKVLDLISAGKKAEVKAIIKQYAERVSAVPEDKRAEVMQKLAALEG